MMKEKTNGQPPLIHNIALKVNDDIKSRVTYSTILPKLNPDDMELFVLKQLDTAGIPHNRKKADGNWKIGIIFSIFGGKHNI